MALFSRLSIVPHPFRDCSHAYLLELPRSERVDVYCDPAPPRGAKADPSAAVHLLGLPKKLVERAKNGQVKKGLRVSFFVPIDGKDSDTWRYAHRRIAPRDKCLTSCGPLRGFELIIDRLMEVNGPFAYHIVATPTTAVTIADLDRISECLTDGDWRLRCTKAVEKKETADEGGKEDKDKKPADDTEDKEADEKETKDKEAKDQDKEDQDKEAEDTETDDQESANECQPDPLDPPQVYEPYVCQALVLLDYLIGHSTDGSQRFQAALYEYELAVHQESFKSPTKIALADHGHVAALLLQGDAFWPDYLFRPPELGMLLEACRQQTAATAVVGYWRQPTQPAALEKGQPTCVPLDSCSSEVMREVGALGGQLICIVLPGSLAVKVGGVPSQLLESVSRILKEWSDPGLVDAIRTALPAAHHDFVVLPRLLLAQSVRPDPIPCFEAENYGPPGLEEAVHIDVFGPVTTHPDYAARASDSALDLLFFLRREVAPRDNFRWCCTSTSAALDLVKMLERSSPYTHADRTKWAEGVQQVLFSLFPADFQIGRRTGVVEVKQTGSRTNFYVLLTWGNTMRPLAFTSVSRLLRKTMKFSCVHKHAVHTPFYFLLREEDAQ